LSDDPDNKFDHSDAEGVSLTDNLELVIDPTVIKLEKVLELAENHKLGAISFRGELPDGTVQWGMIVVNRPDTAKIMDAAEKAMYAAIAPSLWPEEEVTAEDDPIN
jgi:hypothetical protein